MRQERLLVAALRIAPHDLRAAVGLDGDRLGLGVTTAGNHDVARHGETDAQHSLTYYAIVDKVAPRCAWLSMKPLTGRTHQLRAHMNALGLPILGDQIYPELLPARPPEQAPDFSRPLQLLAKSLQFTDPVTGQVRHFESARSLSLPPMWLQASTQA